MLINITSPDKAIGKLPSTAPGTFLNPLQETKPGYQALFFSNKEAPFQPSEETKSPPYNPR